MVLKRLWGWGLGAIWLTATACGGKRATEEPGADTSGSEGDAGRFQAEAGRPENDPGATSEQTTGADVSSAPAARCDTTGSSADITTGGEASSPALDASVENDDTSSTDVPMIRRLEVERVSFVGTECSEGSWCWVTPAPIGEKFTAVGGSADGSVVFAVGAQGACVQHDVAADSWTVHRSINRGDLFDVEVVSATEVWVAGAGGLDSFDGSTWERQLLGWTRSIVQGASGELWAVNNDQLYVREGQEWRLLEPLVDGARAFGERGGVFDIVPGDQAGELWAMTYQDRTRAYLELEIVRLQEGSWSRLEGSYAESYSPRFVRYDGRPYFADGSNWFDIEQGWQAAAPLPDYWAAVPDQTITITGTSLSERSDKSNARVIEVPIASALWAARSDALWVALGSGGLLRANYVTGESTDPLGAPAAPWHTVTGIEWAASESDVWRGPELEHFDGTTWTKVTTDTNAPYVMRIDGSGPDDVWFVAYASAAPWRWDGNLVQEVVAPNPDGEVTRIHAFDAGTVWAGEVHVSNVSVHRFEGDSWSNVKTWTVDGAQFSTYLVDLSGPSPTDAYVALSDHVEHFDGERWETIFVAPEGEVFTAMVADAERVWVLGEDYVYHRDANGDWQQQWYGFQTMEWIGLTEDAVWIMGGWLSTGMLKGG